MRDRDYYGWGCACVVLVAGAALWAGPGNRPAPAAQGEKNSRKVELEDCIVKLLDEVVLSCERPGILGTVSVREGDTVQEGALLAGLKDDVARAALAIAEAEAESDVEIRYAEAARGVADLEHERMVDA